MCSNLFRKSLALTCGATLLAAVSVMQSVSAHGIWVAQRQGNMAFIFGAGPSDEVMDEGAFKGAVGYNKAGEKIEVATEQKNGYHVLPKNEKVTLISATYDNGFWSEQANGEWIKKPKTEVEDAKQSGLYMKYNTTILSADAKAGLVTGTPLEIVPHKNPLSLKQGDKLPIQVYADGKPLAGVEVVAEYSTDRENNVVKTDAEGKAEITIRNNGLNVVATEAKEKMKDTTKADNLGKFATLSFSYASDH